MKINPVVRLIVRLAIWLLKRYLGEEDHARVKNTITTKIKL